MCQFGLAQISLLRSIDSIMKKNLQAVFRIAKQLNYILLSEHKKKMIPLFLVIILSTIFELLGVTIILPFAQAIVSPEVVFENRYLRVFFAEFGISDQKEMLVFIGVVIILLYIVKNAFLIFSAFYQQDFATNVERDLSIKLLNSLMKRPYVYYTETNTAVVQRVCSLNVMGVYNTLIGLLTIVAEMFTIVTIGAFICVTDPIIAIEILAILVATMLLIVVVFRPIIKRLSKKNMEFYTVTNKILLQIIQGIKELYVMDRKQLFVGEFEEAADRFKKVKRNYAFMNAVPERIIEGLCVGGMLGVVVIRLASMQEAAAFIPNLAVFAMAAFKLMPSVGKITGRINTIVYNQIYVQETYDNLSAAVEYELELQEYNKQHLADGQLDSEDDNRHFEDVLEIKNVRWKYVKSSTDVLVDASIKVKKGEAIALIGASGSGKTTISDIILGLYRPQAGGVYMDGIDVYTMPHTWARIVGYVQQSVFISDSNVRDNVTFGMKYKTDDEVWDALDRASIGDFVRSLPEGLDTKVGERGVKFSGGQRQRLAIARALFNKPEILVLDEATSALDNETEKAIMESIDSLQGQVTLIIVAHRLTTIKNCDHIYEIKDGMAVERDKDEVLAGV